MPKKTAYSRSAAQRNKMKQKSFELVRPTSDENVLTTVEESDEANVVDVATSESEEEVELEEVEVKSAKGSKASKVSSPTAAATVSASSAPKSASARMAARRQAAQKSQRSSASLVTAEHYAYVRKDLMFILILAIIMFSAIIIMHFVPAIGG